MASRVTRLHHSWVHTICTMKQKSRFKCLPWPGLNPGPRSIMAAKVTTLLRRTPNTTIQIIQPWPMPFYVHALTTVTRW